MRAIVTTLLLFAACAAPRTVDRTAVVPLGAPQPPVDLTRDQGVRAAADRSPATPSLRPVERSDDPLGGSVSYRTVTEIVEVPTQAPLASAPAGEPGVAWSSGTEVAVDPYVVGYAGSRYRSPRRDRWFPVHTVVGLGIGSAIDHHRWHHGRHGHRGAWIGGGVGLMLDLHRLWR